MNVATRIDIAGISSGLLASFREATKPKSEVFRRLAAELIPMVHQRVHVDGKAANGQQIGTYSNAYLKLRTGDYGNAAKFSRGKNTGKRKDAGAVTKGDNAGASRPRYNRSNESKVVLSLTRQMESDYAVVATDDGWGIGFNNTHNADKARWNDKRYGPTIYELSKEEMNYAAERAAALLAQELT